MATNAVEMFNANWAFVGGYIKEEHDGSPWDDAVAITPTSSTITVLPILTENINETPGQVGHDVAQNSPDQGPMTETTSMVAGSISMYLGPTTSGRSALKEWAQWALGMNNSSGQPSNHHSWSYWGFGNGLLGAFFRGIVCTDTTLTWAARDDASGFLTSQHTVVGHSKPAVNTATAAVFDKDVDAAWAWVRQDPFMRPDFSCKMGPVVGHYVPTETIDLSADVTAVSLSHSRGIDVAGLSRGGATACRDPRNNHGLRSISLNLQIQPDEALSSLEEVNAFLALNEPLQLEWRIDANNSLRIILAQLNIPNTFVREYNGRDGLTPLNITVPISASEGGYLDAMTVHVDNTDIETDYTA
jgi:hypothetical protein